MLEIHVDTEGSVRRLERQLGAVPAGLERAQRRALPKLVSWINRTLLRETAEAAGTTQAVIKSLGRYRASLAADGLSLRIWLGTDPIKAHHLGRVSWTPRMQGARAGRRLFPGAWSWGPGSKTGTAVMIREGGRRLPIAVETVEIDDSMRRRITALQPAIEARYAALLRQELNAVLNVEVRRA